MAVKVCPSADGEPTAVYDNATVWQVETSTDGYATALNIYAGNEKIATWMPGTYKKVELVSE